MLYHAKNRTVKLDGFSMDYVQFGSGKKNLILLPGLGDGLRSMRGLAIPMALMYRTFAKDYKVYVFSRRDVLPDGLTTRDMACDQAQAMKLLGIEKADVIGVSMGGMIAQWLAIDTPELIGKLVLVVTSARSNPILLKSISEWMAQAERDEHAVLMDSNLRHIYSDEYYRKNKWLTPIVGALTKPRSYQRFLVQGKAVLTHNTYERLPEIRIPVLVIGGEQDLTVGAEPSRELASRIPNASLLMYEEWGHGLYDEAKDFQQTVLDYLLK